MTITGTNSTGRVDLNSDCTRIKAHDYTIKMVENSAFAVESSECEHGTFTANKCALAMFTVQTVVVRFDVDSALSVYVSDCVVVMSGTDHSGGHLVSAYKGTGDVDCCSTSRTFEVSVNMSCARLSANAVSSCVGTNTDVASTAVQIASDRVCSMVDQDLTGVSKPAAPLNTAEDLLPTVGVMYGLGEVDVATNAGALGFGATVVVSEESFEMVSTTDAVECTKQMVPKTM